MLKLYIWNLLMNKQISEQNATQSIQMKQTKQIKKTFPSYKLCPVCGQAMPWWCVCYLTNK